MKRIILYLVAVALLNSSCHIFRPVQTSDDGEIEVNLLQINDVYEIAPLSGGKEGGMARVATFKKQYLQKNPNTFLVIAGDFLSPSVYNSLQYMGKPIRGKQMVEAMNAAGVDIAVFGNHEFDIREAELQERIDESSFLWVSSNTFHKKNDKVQPFVKANVGPLPKTHILRVKDADGTTASIGIIGLTLPFNRAEYVSYTDPVVTAKEMYNSLKDSVDAVIAITHLQMEEDERLAREIPGLALIIGGHEHDQRFKKVGNVYITKAMANAKSAYAIKLEIEKKKGKVDVDVKPKLVLLNESVPLDSATNAVVQKWVEIANNNYASLGFDAKQIMITKSVPLDGRETEVRRRETELTKLIVAAMKNAAPAADVVLMNGGSIRVDDIIYPPVSQYDILRTLPFGGAIKEVDMKGGLLEKILTTGKKNLNVGGYLHYNNEVQFDATANKWLINNTPVDPSKTYRVAMAEFLLTGREANLDFLNAKNPDIVKVYETEKSNASLADIRMAVVQYLEKNKNQYRD
ncbi:MAG TPA: bifunctional metallophosphatase/5'-nucleotidase [Flavisolibacter sp.]|nr:bifunctional metallophosphatase/5'-nucleotidase [Flavisolibacter sp.]